jgi:hypothetical protein
VPPATDLPNPYAYLEDLQTKVDARVAGTPGEARAQQWLEQQIRNLGVVPESHEFRYQPDSWLLRARSLGFAVGVIALTLLSLAVNPWLILLGLIIVLVIFGPLWRRLESGTANQIGYNVLAGITQPWSEIVAHPLEKVLILSAHYDTAPTMPAWRSRLGRLNDSFAGLAFLGVVALAAYCLIAGAILSLAQLTGLGTAWSAVLASFWQHLGVWLVLLAGIPGTVVILLSALSMRNRNKLPKNPGADDNGSGVAVVLTLGEQVKQMHLTGWDVVLAFWDAEESGLWGSEAFVASFATQLTPANTVIINIDTVGHGKTLMGVSGQGMLRRQAIDEHLLQTWESACSAIGAETIWEWLTPLTGSSDHAAWLRAGFRKTLSIGRGNLIAISGPLRLLNYLSRVPAGQQQTDVHHTHSPSDDLAHIERESLSETARAVLELLLRL